MFCTEFLHVIRSHELRLIRRQLRSGARLLEIGGGTGWQAKSLADSGFDIVSIDVPQSQYVTERVFPVIDYDGKSIPFADGTFDIVLSSHVLEHIGDLSELHREIRRVLRPGGYSVHVMPSASWRFWTNVANYVELGQRIGLALWRMVPRSLSMAVAGKQILQGAAEIVRAMLVTLPLPPRHGERGNAITEIYYFSRGWWRRHFIAHGYGVIDHRPGGLFYTGHMVFGAKLGIRTREKMARIIGSAGYIFTVQYPVAQANA